MCPSPDLGPTHAACGIGSSIDCHSTANDIVPISQADPFAVVENDEAYVDIPLTFSDLFNNPTDCPIQYCWIDDVNFEHPAQNVIRVFTHTLTTYTLHFACSTFFKQAEVILKIQVQQDCSLSGVISDPVSPFDNPRFFTLTGVDDPYFWFLDF